MNEVVRFQEPRLPFHDAIEQRYGVDRSGWKALTEAVFPNAKTVDSIVMALSYCKARKLDPFKRPVHIVPMWSATERKLVETVWPGVSEIRTTAFRTGQFAGMDAAVFGEEITEQLVGRDDKGNERKVAVTYPRSCQITLYRMLNGQRCAFVGPVVYWKESYGRWKNTEAPNDMWAKRPYGQIEKCAEAGAIRRAFPEEVGNDLSAEEMDGQHLIQDAAPVALPQRRAPSPSAAPMIEARAETPAPRADMVVADTGAIVPDAACHLAPEPSQPARRVPSPSAAPSPQPVAVEPTQRQAPATRYDPEQVRTRLASALRGATSQDDINEAWMSIIDPIQDDAFPSDREDWERMVRLREAEIGGQEGAEP